MYSLHLFPHSSGGRKYKVEGPPGLVSGEVSLPGLWTAAFLVGRSREGRAGKGARDLMCASACQDARSHPSDLIEP